MYPRWSNDPELPKSGLTHPLSEVYHRCYWLGLPKEKYAYFCIGFWFPSWYPFDSNSISLALSTARSLVPFPHPCYRHLKGPSPAPSKLTRRPPLDSLGSLLPMLSPAGLTLVRRSCPISLVSRLGGSSHAAPREMGNPSGRCGGLLERCRL